MKGKENTTAISTTMHATTTCEILFFFNVLPQVQIAEPGRAWQTLLRM
jgi:hypothetical protein